MSRPTYSSANTATTLLSATSCTSASDLASTTYDSTALTTPDLSSPKKGQSGRLETIDDVFVSTPLAGQAFDPAGGDRTRQLSRNRSKSPVMEYRKEERYLESPRRTSLDLSRGPSVKDRAREFEASRSSVTPSSSRPLPSPLQSRTTSSVTTPLRINKTQSTVTTGPSASGSRAYSSLGVGPSPSVAPAYSSAGTGMSTSGSTPRTAKRIPVPSTVSTSKTTSTKHHTDALSPVRSASKGATRKMIQQWESLPSTPAAAGSASSPTTKRVISRDYLDQKPLPIPSASAIASSGPSTPNRATNSAYQVSPARTTYAPSPLYRSHLQTPDAGPSRKRQSVSPSGSAYSLSPSGDKRRKGKSPLKDMLNVFGGGIQAIGRKAKEKGRGMSRYGSRDSLASKGQDSLWSQPSERVGTNGLPGGIVYSDRMGDKEMLRRQSDPTVGITRLYPVCLLILTGDTWIRRRLPHTDAVLFSLAMGFMAYLMGYTAPSPTQNHVLSSIPEPSIWQFHAETHTFRYWSEPNDIRSRCAILEYPTTGTGLGARRRARHDQLCRSPESAQRGSPRQRHPSGSGGSVDRGPRDGMG